MAFNPRFHRTAGFAIRAVKRKTWLSESMVELLKGLPAVLKDYAGLNLPDWLRGFLAGLLFLFLLVFGCGFAYFACAALELPPGIQKEFALPLLRSNDFIRCGLASLGSFIQMIAATKGAVNDIVTGTFLWFLVMGALGLLTQFKTYLVPVLEGRFNARVLKLSEEEQSKLRSKWEESRSRSEKFREGCDFWATMLPLYEFIGAIARAFLILPLLAYSAYLLALNEDIASYTHGALQWAERNNLPELRADLLKLEGSLEAGQLADFCLGSVICVLLAWVVFRYSEANRPLRFVVLITSVINLFILAGRIGAAHGDSYIEFQEVSIDTARENGTPLKGKDLVLMYSMGSRIRAYSCESQKVIEADLAEGDIISYGRSVKLRDLCIRGLPANSGLNRTDTALSRGPAG